MMNEFKIHHHVSELIDLLGVRSSSADSIGAELYTEMLLKNTTPFITTQVSAHQSKKKIAQSTKTPIEFLSKYDDLKAKSVRDLDQVVYLLSKLTDEEETRTSLEKHARDRADEAGMTLVPHSKVTQLLPASGTKMSATELSEVQHMLLKEATSVSATVSSDVLRKMQDKHTKKNVHLPHQPEWMFSRPCLTMDFLPATVTSYIEQNVVPLGTLTLLQQEQLLIDDILCCMQGIEGQYILVNPVPELYAPRQFTLATTMDPSLKELVSRILPLCSNYSTVVRFIEEKSAFEYGLVNHALAAAMRTIIKDYMVLVAQIEYQCRVGDLTLQKMWFYLQPVMRTVDILTAIANSVNRGACIGGSVLSLLHEKTNNLIGDIKGQELCLYLTQSACVPYFEILEKWIYQGVVSDPYSEFLVEENETIQKEKLQEEYDDPYWQQHYVICTERIPIFLEQMADKILNTGKYLNVVRLCGQEVRYPHAEEIVYTLRERKYCEHIEKAHSYASRLLLDLLIEDKELLSRIKSIKYYFLLEKGDFVQLFMDMTEEEMKLDVDNITPSRLDRLLELALRTSTANIDPFKDDLQVALLPFDLISQLFKILSVDKTEKDYRIDPTDLHLSGLEAFAFDYVVKWPVSLVLNRKSLTQYQMLFRHLFYCKHVERQLCNVWIGNKAVKQYSVRSSRWFCTAFALRQKMMNFVQNFEYYMMFEVVEHHWQIFQSNVAKVTNVDDIMAYHTDMLQNCMQDCMLSSPVLLKMVHKLMVVCVTFCNFAHRLNQSTNVELEAERLTRGSTLQKAPTLKERQQDKEKTRTTAKVVSEHIDQLAASENFERTIQTFDNNFTRILLELLNKIMDLSNASLEHKLFNILYRLDFNGFYTEKLEAMSAERAMMNTSLQDSDSSSGHSWPPPAFTSQQPDTARYVPGIVKPRVDPTAP